MISNGNTTVTGIAGRNCSLNECNIDAAWGYTPANTEVVLEHGNTETYRNSPHAVGYSDFYYCLAPPKIVLQKALTGTRVQTTDQFSLEVTGDNTVPTNNFTTTGSGSTIDNNNAATAVAVAPNTTYTIVESIIGGGDIRNYDATYSCSNATTQSATNLSSANGNTVYDSSDNTRSFTLSNLNYGDEITCTITNTPTAYTFSGIVFNDNGGIAENNNTKYDISSTFTGNNNYFNGVFDSSSEVGIETTAGLSVSLTDCKGNNISTVAPNSNPQTQLNSPLGQFKFTVSASAIANLTTKEVCLVQVEPDPWTFSVDTTPNLRKISLAAGKFDYKTDGSRNLDFGEVKANYASLVLIKSQHVNDCDINANYDGISFSTAEINDIEPGKCIAYRIEAYNRGHVDLEDIRISDELQTKAQGGLVNSVFAFPAPKGDPTSLYTRTTLPTGTITSELFKLDKPTGAAPTKATLYFNTKYGTTVDP